MKQTLLLYVALLISCGQQSDQPNSSNKAVFSIPFSGRFPMKVCFVTNKPKWSQYRKTVQTAIEDSWEKYADIDFFGWEECELKNNVVVNYEETISIYFSENIPENVLGKADLPFKKYSYHNMVLYINNHFKFNDPHTLLRDTSAHEFGHLLGFDHEHKRDFEGVPECKHSDQTTKEEDSALTFYGNYDTHSIMYQCRNRHDTVLLSKGDIQALQAIYGPK